MVILSAIAERERMRGSMPTRVSTLFAAHMLSAILIALCMQQYPLRRIGRDDDMAGVAVFLASRAGAYLTGTVIPVDGGIATTA